jgi:hypothetical protein
LGKNYKNCQVCEGYRAEHRKTRGPVSLSKLDAHLNIITPTRVSIHAPHLTQFVEIWENPLDIIQLYQHLPENMEKYSYQFSQNLKNKVKFTADQVAGLALQEYKRATENGGGGGGGDDDVETGNTKGNNDFSNLSTFDPSFQTKSIPLCTIPSSSAPTSTVNSLSSYEENAKSNPINYISNPIHNNKINNVEEMNQIEQKNQPQIKNKHLGYFHTYQSRILSFIQEPISLQFQRDLQSYRSDIQENHNRQRMQYSIFHCTPDSINSSRKKNINQNNNNNNNNNNSNKKSGDENSQNSQHSQRLPSYNSHCGD